MATVSTVILKGKLQLLLPLDLNGYNERPKYLLVLAAELPDMLAQQTMAKIQMRSSC